MTMPSMDPAEPAPPEELPADDGTFTIELHGHPDGTFTLGDNPEVLDTLEDALKAIIREVRSQTPSGASAREQMAAGYGPADA